MPRELDDSDFDAVVDELFGPEDSSNESFGRMRGGGGGHHGGSHFRGGRFHRRGPRRWRYHRWHQRGPWAYPYWGWGYPGYVYPSYDNSIPPLDPDQIGDIIADISEDNEDDEDFGELEFDDEDFGELEFDDEDEDAFGYGEASIEAKLGPYLSRQNTAGLRGYPLEWRWP